MVRLESREGVCPICPHCSGELPVIWTQEITGFLGRRHIYFRPRCRKVLGASRRKGSSMG